MADFLLALAAFDRARRWADLGHASLWAFLHVDLGLSAGAAHCRKVAARLVHVFPAVEAGLRQGELCLTSIVELAKILTSENQAEVLPRFRHLSSREARVVVAELAPAAAFPTRERVTLAPAPTGMPAAESLRAPETLTIQPLEDSGPQSQKFDAQGYGSDSPIGAPSRPRASGPPTISSGGSGAPFEGLAASQSTVTPPVTPTGLTSHAVPPFQVPTGPAARRVPAPPRRPDLPPDEIVPLTGDLRRLHLTVPRRFIEKLAAARSARAHAQPGASSCDVLEAALDLLLARDAARRKAATKRPVGRPRTCAPGRIQARVRREVWRRDEGRCQWPLEGGGVCGSIWRLEVDHVHPRALGGPSTPENLRLLCGPHNAESARRVFGSAFMARKSGRATPPPGQDHGNGRPTSPPDPL